ncbi:hypothetical protein MMC18_002649 [Xylographa bjoerkii]|nr:hypothetical protein [Xylographa bjoerkii]
MTKLPVRPKTTGSKCLGTSAQGPPYCHPDANTQTTATETGARRRPSFTTDDTEVAPNVPLRPSHTSVYPPGGLHDRYGDERYRLEADEKKAYRRNMLLLAEAVRERIAGRGRHAQGRLYDSKLAESVRDLEKLVGCFEHLNPDPRHCCSDHPDLYLAAIMNFWSTQDIPSAAARYVPCWELVAGRILTTKERAAIGIDVYLDGEIRGQRMVVGTEDVGWLGKRKLWSW